MQVTIWKSEIKTVMKSEQFDEFCWNFQNYFYGWQEQMVRIWRKYE